MLKLEKQDLLRLYLVIWREEPDLLRQYSVTHFASSRWETEAYLHSGLAVLIHVTNRFDHFHLLQYPKEMIDIILLH